MSELAILGGTSAISVSHPHFVWPKITKEKIEAVEKQVASGEISIYDDSGIIKELEKAFCVYHNLPYGVATNAGTTALLSAFFGCGIGPGDEVIAPTYTFLATVTPILHVNAVPILVDCDSVTGNISPKEIRKNITSKTKAIVITHVWGHPCEMDEIVAIAKENNLFLIEDCSHAHGACYKNQKVGTFGDVACFSLQGNKIVSAGEGGILLTKSLEIYERATLLGHYRNRSEQCVKSDFYKQFTKTGYGLKLRMHPVGAALALIDFKNLEQNIILRNSNLNYFSEGLSQIEEISPPTTYEYVHRGAFYGYKPHYMKDKMNGIPIEIYVEALRAEGMEISKPGSKPLHMLPLFQTVHDGMYENDWPRSGSHVLREVVYKNGDLPNSEAIYNVSLSLPTFSEINDKKIIDQYLSAFKKISSHKQELFDFYMKMKEKK